MNIEKRRVGRVGVVKKTVFQERKTGISPALNNPRQCKLVFLVKLTVSRRGG